KYASARMKENNPSQRPEVKEKISASRKGKPFPTERGGNGHGLTVPQKMLVEAISILNPQVEYVVKTEGLVPHPPAYKVDIAIPEKMLAIEVDGKSHCALKVKEADKRKEMVLQQKGWKLLRFTNEQILTSCQECVSQIMSTI
ncbi:MAG: endonuclease domain-containing protein, partial [Ruminococcus sp.]|nr:endonuclease domain-containing protein [Ruminococcus sp.]